MNPIIILGTGLAGYNLAKEFRKLDAETPLLMITADEGHSYSKPMLSTGFTKRKTAEELSMADSSAMASQLDATILTHIDVTAIDLAAKKVSTNSDEYSYSQLVLACGAEVIRPPLHGNALDQVYSINDLRDYSRFRSAIGEGKRRVLIIGAGLIGCEFANDLSNGGFEVTVVDPIGRCLPALLPETASAALEHGLESLGVKFVWGQLVKSVDKSEDNLLVSLAEAPPIEADIVISAIGLRPRIKLAEAAGLTVNRGVVVDAFLRTSDENVFALGDCSEVEGHVTLYVLPLMAEARALAKTLSGSKTAVNYGPMPISVKTPCCPVIVAPPPTGSTGAWTTEVSAENNVKAIFNDENGKMVGFALTGELIKEKMALAKQLPPLLG